jgi:hypothetical protein
MINNSQQAISRLGDQVHLTAYSYKAFKNKLTSIMRAAERSHYQNELLACKGDMRKSWKIIKDIINKNSKKTQKLPKITINGNLCENPQNIADAFNKYFSNIGPTLDRKIPPSNGNPLKFINSNYTVNLFLKPSTPHEIDKIIDKLNNCAVGWDQLPAFIFKDNKDPLSGILNHIMNLSLEQGTFPKELKLANIIPIFKAGETDIIGNYRPVSLLTTVSKVFERAIYNRLVSFITQQKILYSLQFGFREGHGTHMAILKLLDNVIYALDRGDYAATIYLDFSKAFDTVNHHILLQKMNH